MKRCRVWCGVFASVGALAFCGGCDMPTDPGAQTEDNSPQAESGKDVPTIDAIKLWNMADNEAKMKKRFPGRFRVEGKVFRVEKEYDGWHLQLFCHENVRGVDGWIDCKMSTATGLDDLSQGNSVTVEGIYSEGTGAVVEMDKCRVVK